MKRADIESIGNCFFPADRLVKADVAIVFGMSDPTRPAQRAIELFHAGMVGQLVFTGGYNKRLGEAEARVMAKLATESGVPADAMLIEDRAQNTEENVKLSLGLLSERVGSALPGSILLLTIRYHLRRAYIAARRHFPTETAIGWTCYESRHYTSADWFEVDRGRRDVMTEIEKIDRYCGLSLDEVARQSR
ncbi:MAG: YdcF family protein [Rhizobiaceae bacterium]|nr:YdcF family protein [Rhizobiaceae bacterium]